MLQGSFTRNRSPLPHDRHKLTYYLWGEQFPQDPNLLCRLVSNSFHRAGFVLTSGSVEQSPCAAVVSVWRPPHRACQS